MKLTKVFAPGVMALVLVLGSLSPASADEQVWHQGDIAVRLGASGILPSPGTGTKGGDLTNAGLLDDTRVRVGNDYKPTFNFAYFLTDNIDVEVLGAWPFKSNMKLRGGALDGTDFGSVHYLPPTLTFNYHFETGTPLVPYIGAGASYTFFFNQSVHNEAAGAGVEKFKVKNTLSPTAQVGLDYFVTDHFFVNANVRYMYMKTRAKIKSAAGQDKINMHLNPWVYSVNIGWRF